MLPSKEKIEEQEKRIKLLNILPKDIKETFIKASGKGGQKVNKSNSSVMLQYAPYNLTVKANKSRSQTLNRFLALRTLLDKIEAIQKKQCHTERM